MNKLSHGIINADELKLEVERSIVIEHLKETNTSWHNSHSFGMNFGAMMGFANIHSVTSGMMAIPVVRNEKGYSIEETISKSGIYAKENHIKIGKTIEMTPTLRNEEKISIFDTAPISSIGSMMSGVQEIKDLAKELKMFKEAEFEDASPEGQEFVPNDFEGKFVEEAKVLVAKANEVEKAIEEKKAENQDSPTVTLKTYDDIVDECIDVCFASQSTDPRDFVMSAQANCDVEDLVRKATLLRYDIEDFIEKYPNAAEWCAKIFVGATYVLQGAEYAVAFGAAGPAGVSAKYATQESIATGVEHSIEVASEASAAALTKDPILQAEYSQTFKCFSYIGMCLGSVKPAKQLVKALKQGSAARRQAQPNVANVKFPSTKGYYKSVTKYDEAGALACKYALIEKAQRESVSSMILLDGRIRYYLKEIPATKPGNIRGANLVIEHNQKTGAVRSWYEVKDHSSNVMFVHPKNINGVTVNVPHYPHIAKDYIDFGDK